MFLCTSASPYVVVECVSFLSFRAVSFCLAWKVTIELVLYFVCYYAV